jgi:hypothetical protein
MVVFPRVKRLETRRGGKNKKERERTVERKRVRIRREREREREKERGRESEKNNGLGYVFSQKRERENIERERERERRFKKVTYSFTSLPFSPFSAFRPSLHSPSLPHSSWETHCAQRHTAGM